MTQKRIHIIEAAETSKQTRRNTPAHLENSVLESSAVNVEGHGNRMSEGVGRIMDGGIRRRLYSGLLCLSQGLKHRREGRHVIDEDLDVPCHQSDRGTRAHVTQSHVWGREEREWKTI